MDNKTIRKRLIAALLAAACLTSCGSVTDEADESGVSPADNAADNTALTDDTMTDSAADSESAESNSASETSSTDISSASADSSSSGTNTNSMYSYTFKDLFDEAIQYYFEEGGEYAADTDSDGIPDLMEDEYGLDANNPDTDGDGYSDYEEFDIDTDSDGLPDVAEEAYSSSYYEGLDPNNPDSDGDGFSDGIEVMYTFTDPVTADSDKDTDEDGLTALQEYENGTSDYNDDSDYDGLLDGEEVNTYKTDPLVADTDGDGLFDGDEIYFGCDPNNPDSDGDGTLDGDEKHSQKYVYTAKSDCKIKEITIEAESSVNIQNALEVESIMDKDYLCTTVLGLVGEPFSIDFGYNYEADFDSFELTFVVEDYDLNNAVFLWYDEENEFFMPIVPTIDEKNSSLTVTAANLGKYMVVDKKQWYDAWGYEEDQDFDIYIGDKKVWEHEAETN